MEAGLQRSPHLSSLIFAGETSSRPPHFERVGQSRPTQPPSGCAEPCVFLWCGLGQMSLKHNSSVTCRERLAVVAREMPVGVEVFG